MRILWVKVGGLWPLDTGGRRRSFHIIEELSRRHRVTLLTTHGPGDAVEELTRRLPLCAEVVSVPYSIRKHGSVGFAITLARSWASPLPVDCWKCQIPALRGAVARHMSAGDVDLCVADFLVAAPNVPFEGPIPVVLFEHNVEHMIWKRLARVETRVWRRALLELEWRKMRRYEARTCARANATIAVSEIDRALLAVTAPRARVSTIPTGVDIAYFHPNGATETPASLVFTGSMDWYPNEDGILYFIDTILPRIRRVVPGASLTVVGRRPTSRLLAAATAAGVRVTGTVDDVRSYVAEAAVCVVPLRIGGGTRLKIFEALAMGKAVVSTSVGAEGLPLVAGEHFVQVDDPARFAETVVALLRQPERRRVLGSAGRRLVEQRYSWNHVARAFAMRCEEAVHAG